MLFQYHTNRYKDLIKSIPTFSSFYFCETRLGDIWCCRTSIPTQFAVRYAASKKYKENVRFVSDSETVNPHPSQCILINIAIMKLESHNKTFQLLLTCRFLWLTFICGNADHDYTNIFPTVIIVLHIIQRKQF